jgi:hypothetical protein
MVYSVTAASAAVRSIKFGPRAPAMKKSKSICGNICGIIQKAKSIRNTIEIASGSSGKEKVENSKFRYYVSYCWSNSLSRTSGQGWRPVGMDHPICGVEDIEVLVDYIQKSNPKLGDVVIMNWRRFEDYE